MHCALVQHSLVRMRVQMVDGRRRVLTITSLDINFGASLKDKTLVGLDSILLKFWCDGQVHIACWYMVDTYICEGDDHNQIIIVWVIS